MKTGFILMFLSACLTALVCNAKMAEKVSEDENFVVYRIPVRDLDLQSQASRYYEGISPSVGRSSSKSSSTSKSSSSSTGSGKGKGYGEGSSSAGHGHGHGGSSHGYGHGGSEGGYSSGEGYGQGGSSDGYAAPSYGHGYGGSSGGYGHGGSSAGYGRGYGSSGHGSGYGGSGSGYGGSGSGYGGSGSGYGGSSYGQGYGGQGIKASYTPAGYEDDEEEPAHPKIVTTTKSFTTTSAQDTGYQPHQYRQTSDSLGQVNFRLGDYLKNTPGHEVSAKFSQKLLEDFAASNPGYRSGQGFSVNDFTRSLNQGLVHQAPTYRSSAYLPQASILYPTAYALRNSGFGLGGF